uniref:mRNA capping enzyme adenylation domain-containing protein n=1 Tax=viral metagenome TaxID=1070528 RepID=A0A6C0HYB0_9ZZZZ
MHELTSYQIHELMQRFPNIELSYETHPHKKVSSEYNVCMAIPVGRKCFAWFTFYGDKNVCFIIELNREKKAGKISVSSMQVPINYAKGTLLYGTILDNPIQNTNIPVFLTDDIFYFCGIPTRNLLFSEKLGFIDTFFRNYAPKLGDICINLPIMWQINNSVADYEAIYEIPEKWSKNMPYTVHHIQYRCLNVAGPFFNIMPTRKLAGPTAFGSSIGLTKSSVSIPTQINPKIRLDSHKQQYRNLTVFIVMADMQYDVYHLYAYGRNKDLVYCGVAYIANYKSSMYMNSIFRKIKENANLDAIEESDDEEDFEDVACDKYVDLEKKVQIECKWNIKFKKWEPVRKLDGSHKVVHISQLASNY